VLVVDDDPRLRDLLRRYLGENGFTVQVADSAPAFNKLWLRERYEALILDLMLPGEDGLSILRRLRGARDATPIIMLTAKGEDVDRIVGLELGADDYLPKPFNPRELLARLHAVLRRRDGDEHPGAPAMQAEVVHFGGFALDLATRVLTRNGEPVAITTGEFIRQTCFETLRVTSDEEIRLTAYVDKNEDGNLDKLDLEFVENADGNLEAEFTVFQQEFVPGFKLWAFMDAPAQVDGRFSSCDPTQGTNGGQYVDEFQGGRPFRFLLNRPDFYITEGDWVTSEPHEYNSVDDEVTITLDWKVVE
jgi:DNA-binding response OmpR family regulator